MKLISLTLIVLFINFNVFGQSIKGIIKDSKSKEVIPYVNIGVLNKGIGTVSNNNGFFKLEMPIEYRNDTLQISSIGYVTKRFHIKELLKKNVTISIQLVPEIIELEEIVISTNKKKLKETVIGNKTKSKKLQLGFKNALLGTELGSKMKVKNTPVFLKALHINVVKNTRNLKFRLNFYDIKNNYPNTRINNENIIFQIDIEEGTFTLDISKYNIVMKEIFFCTIELIENLNKNDSIMFSTNLRGEPSVLRNTSQANWGTFGVFSIGLNLTVVKEKNRKY